MKSLFFLTIFLWSATAHAQWYSGLEPARRVQLADSLTMLHNSRLEANAWRTSFLQSDSLNKRKDVSLSDLDRSYQLCKQGEEQRNLQASAAGEQTAIWRRKAQVRSVKIAAVLAAFVGYVVIRK